MNRRGTSKRKEGNSHISLPAIQQYLLQGGYPLGSSTLDKRSIRKRAESFRIDDGGELFYIVRPKRLDDEPPDPDPGADRLNYRKAVFTVRDQLTLAANLHVNAKGIHMGTERTLNALTSKYYWVGMSATVRKVIKNCAVCLANRPVTSQYQASPGILEAPIQGESKENVVSDVSVTVEKSLDKTTSDELQYIVKAEIENPQQSNSANVHFDPNLVLRYEDNMLSASQILKARRFWERVEIFVLGVPDPIKERKISYILVAVDAFSKWPEALKLETLNEKTISQFLFQLISRYGVMEQLIMLENETLRGACLVYSAISENLTMFNITLTSESLNHYDDSWIRITKNLEQFVQQYPNSWSQSLDLCLLPLRMSVSSRDDYSPAYLLMNRDPKFPSSVLPERDSAQRELMLHQCQLQKATNRMMSGFLECSIPDVKRVAVPSILISSTITGVAEKDYSSSVRRSNRKSKKSHRLAGFDGDPKLRHHYKENEHARDFRVFGLDYTEENSSIPLKKRKMSDNLKGSNEFDDANSQKYKKDGIKKISEEERIIEILRKMGTDMFYLIIKRFLENASFPPNSPISFKQAVKKSSDGYSLEDGKLMLCHKGVKKTVMSTLSDRLGILNEIHTLKGEHLPKSRVLDELEHRLVIWRDMAIDVDAFVKACPSCKHGNIRRKSTKFKKWRKDWDTDIEDDEASEDEINEGEEVGKGSYDDLIWYLKKNIYPEHLTRAELVVFKKKAKNFKLVKGSLHYCPGSVSKAKPRKVLLSHAERQAAMTKAHGDNHLLKPIMIIDLRKRYFWHAMSHDVERFIESCCQPYEIEDKDARDERLTERIKQFQDYFQGNELQAEQPEALETLFEPPEGAEPDTVYQSQNPILEKPSESLEPEDTSGVDAEVVVSLDEQTGLLWEEGSPSKPGKIQQPIKNSESENQTSEKENRIMDETDSSALRVDVPALNDFKSDIKQPGEAASDQDIKDISNKNNNNNGMDEEDNRGNDMEHIEKVRNEDWKPPSETKVSLQESIHAAFLSSKPLLATAKKKVERIRCEICHIIVRGENNYKEHKYKHTGIKPFHCQQCTKTFTSVKGLRMHMRKHTGHRPYLCNICGRGFPRSAALRYHIKTHDRPAFVPVTCDICNRKFTTEHRLLKHKRFKHPAEAPVFKCEQCGRQFTAKRSLKRHQRAHEGIRRYECPHCKRSFFRKEYLNYHLESHFKDDPSRGPLSVKRRLKKRALMQRQQAKKEPVLSIVSVDQPTGQFSQLVGVAHPRGWPEVENPTQDGQTLPAMISLDGGLRVGDIDAANEPSTTVVMVQESSAANGEMQVRHYIMPQSPMQQDPQQNQQQQLDLQPQNQQQDVKHAVLANASGNEDQPRMIEVTLSTGQQHTLTLAGTNTLQIGDSSQETIQYHVECLHGETLTEADFQAIQMLAQASVLQQH